jgi:hypothetical protein
MYSLPLERELRLCSRRYEEADSCPSPTHSSDTTRTTNQCPAAVVSALGTTNVDLAGQLCKR